MPCSRVTFKTLRAASGSRLSSNCSVTAVPDLRAVDQAARAFVDASRRAHTPVVLAVSGGCDSMVLMHAVAAAGERSAGGPRDVVARVLTFDHGTGPAASAAAALVAREGIRLGFEVRSGHASLPRATEAEWRAARWRFFREATLPGARVATAHTRDDQLETIVMRVMREMPGSAASRASPRSRLTSRARFSSSPARQFGRMATLTAFCLSKIRRTRRGEYLRNRMRLDLLPAIDTVRPRFAAEMLALAERAAAWRVEVDALVARLVSESADDGIIRVAREELATYDSSTLCVLWPAIAARASVTLDRRGTLRLAQFTSSGAPGARMQLSGARRGLSASRFFRSPPLQSPNRDGEPGSRSIGVVQFGGWRFRPVRASGSRDERSLRRIARRGSARATVRIRGLPIFPRTGGLRFAHGVPPTECDRETVGRHVV